MPGKAREQLFIKCQGRQKYSNHSREGKRTIIHKMPWKAREQQSLKGRQENSNHSGEGKRAAITQGKAREHSESAWEGKRTAITQGKSREQQSLKGMQENSNYSESAREGKRTATTHNLPGKAREQQVSINCQGR